MWRHGRTAWNVAGRFQGHSDIELDAVGRQQAVERARLLAAFEPDAIVSSDLARAAATADELARLTGLSVSLDPDLREICGGRWEGRTSESIGAEDLTAYDAWRRGDPVRAGGDGETRFEVGPRAVGAIRRALDAPGAPRNLVVVTHGGTARAAIGLLLGLPEAAWMRLGGLGNCCWSVLQEWQGGWELVEHNAGTLPEPVIGDDA